MSNYLQTTIVLNKIDLNPNSCKQAAEPSGAILAHDKEIVRFSPYLFGENQQFLNRGYT
jgi:hypothetical protein